VAFATTWALGWTGPFELLAVLAAEWVSMRAFRVRLEHVTRAVEPARRQLAVLAQLYARLERESFTDPNLVRLRSVFAGRDDGHPPAFEAIARLERIVSWLEARRNQ